MFLSSADFFQNHLFQNILSGISPECQAVWIQIRPDILSGLICIQTVCNGYQQTTLVVKELTVYGMSHVMRKVSLGLEAMLDQTSLLSYRDWLENCKYRYSKYKQRIPMTLFWLRRQVRSQNSAVVFRPEKEILFFLDQAYIT